MAHTYNEKDQPVGLVEVADMPGMSLVYLRSLSFNGKLPKPAATVSGRIPVWKRATIEAWLTDRAEAKAKPAAKPRTRAGKPKAAAAG